jgi:phosphoglycolate phosphatase
VSRPALDCVIFDLDGVVVDSHDAVTGSINAALAEHGFQQRPPAELRHYIGPPTHAAFGELSGYAEGSPELERIIATYRRHYASVYLDQTTAIAGITDALETLSQTLDLAIATSKSVLFTQPLLDALALGRYFAVVEAAAPNDSGDDKTAIVARAVAALGERGRSRAAMVGDRSYDIVAARAHGLLAIGVTWGIGSEQELREAGAQRVAHAPVELVALLNGAAPDRH